MVEHEVMAAGHFVVNFAKFTSINKERYQSMSIGLIGL